MTPVSYDQHLPDLLCRGERPVFKAALRVSVDASVVTISATSAQLKAHFRLQFDDARSDHTLHTSGFESFTDGILSVRRPGSLSWLQSTFAAVQTLWRSSELCFSEVWLC